MSEIVKYRLIGHSPSSIQLVEVDPTGACIDDIHVINLDRFLTPSQFESFYHNKGLALVVAYFEWSE